MDESYVDVQEELDALHAIYEESLSVNETFPQRIGIALRPHTAEDATIQELKDTKLPDLTTGAAGGLLFQYPEDKLQVQLRGVKGLGDRRRDALLAHLRLWLAEQPPGPLLVGACEEAKDQLTAMNEPDGDCCFCLEPVVGPASERPYMKLITCFHCFHTNCFRGWWEYEVDERTVARRQAPNPPHLASAKREKDPSLLNCPICRAEMTSEDVSHLSKCTVEAKLELRVEDGGEASGSSGVTWEALTAAEEARRASYAILYARQEARDGVIKSKRVEMIPPAVSPPSRSADGKMPLVEKEEDDMGTSTQHVWAREVGYDVSPFPFLQSKASAGHQGSQRNRGQGQKRRTRRGGPSRNQDNELG